MNMDKPEQQMDQIFQNRLKDASVQPPSFVWPAVEKELRQRQRRPFVWWWMGGAGLVAIAALWYFAGNQAVDLSTMPGALPAGPAQQNISVSPDRVVNSAATAGVTTIKAASDVPDFAPSPAAKTPFVDKSVLAGKTGFTPVPQKSGKVAVAKDLPEAQKGTEIVGTTPVAAGNSIFSPTNTGELQESLMAANTQLITSPELLPAPFTLLQPKISHPSPKGWPVKIIKKKKDKNGNCYDFASHRNALLLEGFIGPVSASKDLSALGSSENKQYLIKRQQTEGHGWGFNGGLRATYLFREHFSVSAGLQYDQFTEVFSYADPNSIYVLTKASIIPGTDVIKLDTVDIYFGTEQTKSFNRYSFLDIPLSIGYEIRQGRGGIRAQGGASINLLFHKRGTIISPLNDKPAQFTPGKGTLPVFNTNAGLSLQGSVQFFWSLEPRTRLFAEPYFRKILDPVTPDSHPLTQRYSIWGVRLGMAKIF